MDSPCRSAIVERTGSHSLIRDDVAIAEKNKGLGMTAEAAGHFGFVETMRGKSVAIAGLPNRLFVVVAKLLPSSVFTGIVRFINRLRWHQK